MTSKVFDEIVRLSGLSPIFANTAVKRAVERSGVDPATIAAADLERILPELERAMRVYLGDDAGKRLDAIRKQLGR